PNRVFQLEDCLIARESLMRVWRRLQAACHLLPDGAAEIQLREARDGRVHVVIRGGPAGSAIAQDALAGSLGEGVTLWWAPRDRAARPLAGTAEATRVSAFEQVNPELGERIRRDAVAALGVPAGGRVWDLYGGVGETARLAAAAGAHVWSVDADRAAIRRARALESGASGGSGEIRYLAKRAEDAVRELPEPDRIVVNPPRRGLGAAVAARIDDWGAAHAGARLVYVSCDPATLARDLTRLERFSLTAVRAYDLFPQTSHVETLALLETA
ncbi:MAG: hypothetical protein PVF27_05860, partial [Gemmatimonadales bacterium]